MMSEWAQSSAPEWVSELTVGGAFQRDAFYRPAFFTGIATQPWAQSAAENWTPHAGDEWPQSAAGEWS